MAYHDALFQLGMDLTRSSTAQKEDHGETARLARPVASVPGPHEDRRDFFIGRESARSAGHHLIIDLVGASRLDDLKHIEHTLERCVEVAGARKLHVHLHRDASGDVSGFAALAGSHIGFHSSPSAGYAAVDVIIRGHRRGDERPHRIVDLLCDAFMAREALVKSHRRGPDAASLVAPKHESPVAARQPARAPSQRQLRKAKAA
jgi:S-adenosylmethionine decarboxylase